MRVIAPVLAAMVSFVAAAFAGPYPPLAGTADTKLKIDRLAVLGSVLMIAAHPDDENTALLAYLARGKHLRTGYLSLTRGEGGQNLIGSELGDALGVIRTQELLMARRVDGAEQFFTRAIDFGFTKTTDETFAKWGRERILEDVVRAIRTYRPDVIVLRFSGTPRDGHGQHQASAILGKDAFIAAADPNRFPDAGPPWQAKRVLFNVFAFTREQQAEVDSMPGKIVIDTGEYSPLLGRSFEQIAAVSRSQHRSQAMGSPERPGARLNHLVTVAGDAAAQSMFDGVDTTWNRVAGGAAAGALVAEASRTFEVEHPEKAIPLLLKARAAMRTLRDPWVDRKREEIDEAIAACAGVYASASADRWLAVPASKLRVTSTLVNRSGYPMTWKGRALAKNEVVTEPGDLIAPDAITPPFWLARPRSGDTYEIPPGPSINAADNERRQMTFVLGIDGETIEIRREVSYRYVDPADGELERAVIVAPPVSVNLPDSVFVFPNGSPQKISVQVRANAPGAAGSVRLDAGQGWKVEPASRAFSIAAAGDQADLEFTVTPAERKSRAMLRAVASVAGTETSLGLREISYPHIPPQVLQPRAEARLESFDVQLLSKKIGYITGAGDDVPRALRQLGADVALLTADDLARGDLRAYDSIVTGVRAFNTRPDLRANAQRLFDYVAGGGSMVVQYNVAEGGFFQRATGALDHVGPYPLKVGSKRVTVEESPVTFLAASHPLLSVPNRIGPDDFAGWIQERGLYFPSEWSSEYQPVIASADPGEELLPGGILIAKHGKGHYIYTSYAWFRELPAGVPGAYRLFANLVSVGKKP